VTQWGVDTLFNPAKRHMDEEKRRLQATRQQVGDPSGGKRIDLESGKVRIGKPTDADGAGEADETESAASDPDAKSQAKKSEAKPDAEADAKRDAKADAQEPSRPAPSPAAVRAAARRGRQPR
jgi:hypothetical protein